ncbi:MAG: hypothetical protein JWN68_287 [Nocardioides sp.]|jgi:Mce-associated membrane protein|uniref:hypothetical protein n=1 Tax=Nocardioides sp. TaxID=35761 RepID=UPI00262F96A5|nr:hypothetical protein [Nocardioides sp.]MCW2832334.1 hypothetical protein [Nocardioides sp.]
MDLRRLNLVLMVLGLALVAAVAFLQAEESTATASEAELHDQRSLDVTMAATAQVQAFLGIDHRNVDAQAQVVLDGATGEFEQQYAEELDSLRRSARAQESTAEATVLEVGISDIDATTATVIVAADTDVTSKATDGKSRTVPWRIQLDMVREGDRWLTAGLQFVG